MRFSNKILLLASCFASSALGRTQQEKEKNTANVEDAPIPDIGICPTDDGGRRLKPSPTWRGADVCNVFAPGDVVNFRVQCDGATYLDFQIADCCIPGDRFQLKGKNWDTAPNTAVTTSPGDRGVYGVPARVYNYGGTSFNPGNIDALVECTYLHGVDVIPAGSYVYFESDGTNCVITRTDVSARIDRSP